MQKTKDTSILDYKEKNTSSTIDECRKGYTYRKDATFSDNNTSEINRYDDYTEATPIKSHRKHESSGNVSRNIEASSNSLQAKYVKLLINDLAYKRCQSRTQ